MDLFISGMNKSHWATMVGIIVACGEPGPANRPHRGACVVGRDKPGELPRFLAGVGLLVYGHIALIMHPVVLPGLVGSERFHETLSQLRRAIDTALPVLGAHAVCLPLSEREKNLFAVMNFQSAPQPVMI